MNNAISEIKNTLEATNSRITEAEDRITMCLGVFRLGFILFGLSGFLGLE